MLCPRSSGQDLPGDHRAFPSVHLHKFIHTRAHQLNKLVIQRDQLVKAQKMGERSDQRVQLMMARASVGIVIADFEGGISYTNDPLLEWIGYNWIGYWKPGKVESIQLGL